MPGIADLIAAKGDAPGADEPALGSDVAEAPEKPAAKAKAPEPEDAELGLEGEGDAPAKQVPLRHLTEQRAKRRQAEQERDAARAEAQAAKERTKVLERLYGKFEKPEAQLEEDATVAEAMWTLKDKPEIQAALRLIQEHAKGVKVSDRTVEKPVEAKPEIDPLVQELYAERVKDRAEAVLKDAKVRAELHGPILAYVLEQKGLKPTREAVLAAMNEYVTSQGWTRQFLRGGTGEKRPLPLPNPGGLNAGVAPKGEKTTPERPKSLSQLQDQNRNKFRELIEQRMPR